MIYSKQWSQFETQSLAFGLLRKAMYPQYLVRGYDGEIHLFTPTADTKNPIPRLIILVEESTAAGNGKVEELPAQNNIPKIKIVGGEKAYAVVEIIQKYLN